MKKRRWLLTALAILIGLWLAARLANSAAEPNHRLGIADGRLAPCPESPNCVATQTKDAEQQMAALPLSGTPAEAIARLQEIIAQMPGATIVSSAEVYLHAEFRSRLMGYVDDVEFYADASTSMIHFRSASRVGYSDLGVNRARMEEIVARFSKQ